jgi:hypothetical protein
MVIVRSEGLSIKNLNGPIWNQTKVKYGGMNIDTDKIGIDITSKNCIKEVPIPHIGRVTGCPVR